MSFKRKAKLRRIKKVNGYGKSCIVIIKTDEASKWSSEERFFIDIVLPLNYPVIR